MTKKRNYYQYLIIIVIVCLIHQPINAKTTQNTKDLSDLEAKVDAFMNKSMDEHHVTACTLAIVKEGNIVFKKGYGVSDITSEKPVDPDNTIFRIGSVSKVITATAVMQLVDQGKIDLNEDINTYLDSFKIRTKYDKPITMAHLLTHTAGFDEKIVGINRNDLSQPDPIGKYLEQNMPPVIREPGEVNQYSNHGMALAGYIVEVVSGIPFNQYIDENIIEPLGMDNSSFSLSSDLLKNMTLAYEYLGNEYVEVKPYHINMPQVGSFNTTAEDMAKFLIAHLQNGEFENKRILEEESALKMHTQQFSNHEDMLGMTFGLHENMRSGYRVIEHGGSLPPFMSFISMLQDKNLGFFISTNSSSGKKLIEEFSDYLYECLIQEKPNSEIPNVSAIINTDLKKYEGEYKRLRVPKESIVLGYESIKISTIDGSLILQDGRNQEKYTPIKEDLFLNVSRNSYIGFKENEEGKMYLFSSPHVLETYEKMSRNKVIYHSIIYYIMIFAIIISLVVCIGWIINLFRKKKHKLVGVYYWGQLFTKINCLIMLLLTGALFMYLSKTNFTQSLKINSLLIITLCMGVLIAVITVALSLYTLFLWVRSEGTIWNRIYNTIIVFSSIGFISFLNELNLLGFKL